MKRVGLIVAAVLAPVALMTVSAHAQGKASTQDNTSKVNRDVARAVSTLDDIQKLGREIESKHRAELAAERRSVRASVRTASQTDATVTKKNAKKAGSKAKSAKKKKNPDQ
jgi:hypothetical protein